MPGEPDAVRLVGGLVAVAALVGMSADIKHGGQFLSGGDLGRPIEIARDVQSGLTLVVQHVDDIAIPLHRPGDGRVQISPCWQRMQPQHVQEFLTIAFQVSLPMCQ